MKKLWRLIRSRNLAVWTIGAFAAYAAVATIITNGDWSVPYRSPLFLGIAGLLTLSTGACAWERTRAARLNARLKPAAPAVLERLRAEPPMVVLVASAPDPLARAEAALTSLRMRVLRRDGAIEARAGVAGAFGSPLFHWALALLFVVIALGQLTRAEGMMGIVAGSSKPDAPESYGTLETGPLAGPLSGRIIAVPSIESSHVANGVDQGVTPCVEIRTPDGLQVLASGYAYPNHPIRYRSMLVHLSNDGLGAIVEVSGAGAPLTQEVLLDYNQERTAIEPATMAVRDDSGSTIADVTLAPGAGSTPANPTVSIHATAGAAAGQGGTRLDRVIGEGESVTIPGDLTLTVVRLTKYARLSVVDDWSVYWIYTLFALAALGLTFAVFAPLRRVRVLLVEDGNGVRLHAAVRHGRGDPHFPARVEAALTAAMDEEARR